MPCVLSYRRIQRTQFSLSLKRKCSEGYRAGGTVYFIQMVFTWVELILLTNAWAWKPTPSRSEDTGASHWGGSRNVTLFSVLCGTMKLVLSVHSWCEGSAFFGKNKKTPVLKATGATVTKDGTGTWLHTVTEESKKTQQHQSNQTEWSWSNVNTRLSFFSPIVDRIYFSEGFLKL